jgi:hypothetical protein
MSGRVSSLPTIPLPLGPGRLRTEILKYTEFSSPESEALTPRLLELGHKPPNTVAPGSPRFWYEMLNPEGFTQDFGGPSYKSSSVHGHMAGLHQRRGDTDAGGSPSLKSHSFGNGVGHSNQDTDPFVDDAGSRTIGTPRHFSLPYQSPSHVPKTPELPTASAPVTPLSPSFVAGPAPSPRLNLPVPPRPLSSIHGQYQHTPEARARLDAQKKVRSFWIRESAAQIAQLSGLRYVAQRRYEETNNQEDYDAWQQAEAAFAAATDLEIQKEERRNLFLADKGMVALKTDIPGDASASVAGQAEGEERLLGFKMAYMERVCAEVKREGESEGDITKEMLETLTLEEKKALRAHLVARLARIQRTLEIPAL